MLTGLAIRNIVLIEALDLVFERGLTVLTGETGAGKSILLDALGLALGMRADSGLVRAGADQASVTATFDPPAAGSPLSRLLADNDLSPEPGEPVIIRRTLKADGGSRAFINDQPCSAALLRDVGAFLVEIHGQHDERGLLNPRGHLDLLDAFGGLDTAPVRAAHAALEEARARLEAARDALANAARERDYLAHSVEELNRFAPQPGEEESLATERADMQKGARLGEDLAALESLLGGSDGAYARLRQAARRLDRIAGEHDLLAAALAAFDRAVIEAEDAEDQLSRANEALAVDPGRLDAIETRLFDLRALARKHQVAPDDLAALAEQMTAQLSRIDAGEAGLRDLEAEVDRARAHYDRLAEELGAARRKAAAKLDKSVAAELAPLKLDAARFRTDVETLPEGQSRPTGRERVEFMISTNPGAPFAQLTKIASGGELSRFILSLKVALAAQGGAGTMIFDEIDRGVGGAVAGAIGDRLARLAQEGQVIVVTHSPQVAARAAEHLLIAKSSQGTITRTGVHPLDDAQRREEIARMLSGAAITDEARAQAVRLLEGV